VITESNANGHRQNVGAAGCTRIANNRDGDQNRVVIHSATSPQKTFDGGTVAADERYMGARFGIAADCNTKIKIRLSALSLHIQIVM